MNKMRCPKCNHLIQNIGEVNKKTVLKYLNKERSQGEIARYLGVTSASVYKILKYLKNKGLIKVSRFKKGKKLKIIRSKLK